MRNALRRNGGNRVDQIYVKRSETLSKYWHEKYLYDRRVEVKKFPKNVVTWSIESAKPGDPSVCSHFDCGRTLSLLESLCGQKCIKHSGKGETIY